MPWRGALALLLVLLLSACGLSPHEVDDAEVRELEQWLEQRTEVSSVHTERGTSMRAGLGGRDEWASTRAVVDPGITAEQLLSLGQDLRERDEPRTISRSVQVDAGGLTLWLGTPSPESDGRNVELLVLIRDALGDISAQPVQNPDGSDWPPGVGISHRDIELWVDHADLDDAASALAAIEPPDQEKVRVDVRATRSSSHPESVRTFVLGGEEASVAGQQPALAAVAALEEAGLDASLHLRSARVPVVGITQVTTREEWVLALDTLAEHAPEVILSTSLHWEMLGDGNDPVSIDLVSAAVTADAAHRLPDLLRTVPEPWTVTKVDLTSRAEITATLEGYPGGLAELAALASAPEWPLSEVVDAYGFLRVHDGTLGPDNNLVLSSDAEADLSFLDLHRAADRAGRVHPDVNVSFRGIFRLDWDDGAVGEAELRPVLEALRGDWGQQRVSISQGSSGSTAIFFGTTGTGTAGEVSASTLLPSPKEKRAALEELGWVVDLWDETAP